jgi:hypothetical protein
MVHVFYIGQNPALNYHEELLFFVHNPTLWSGADSVKPVLSSAGAAVGKARPLRRSGWAGRERFRASFRFGGRKGTKKSPGFPSRTPFAGSP